MAASSSITWASEVPGTRREVRGTITFDSSYATGGEAVTLAQLGLTRLDWLSVETTDGAPLAEVPSTTNVSTVVVRFHATGA